MATNTVLLQKHVPMRNQREDQTEYVNDEHDGRHVKTDGGEPLVQMQVATVAVFEREGNHRADGSKTEQGKVAAGYGFVKKLRFVY